MTPTLTILSLGAGVQSTTLALLAVEGVLPKPDAAIFADTGWEPKAVYDHLGKLTEVMDAAGIPVHLVCAGDIRRDALDPDHRYASVPYFTQLPPGPCRKCNATGRWTDPVLGEDVCPRCSGSLVDDGRGIGRRQCTGEYKIKPIKLKVREMLGYPHPRRVPKTVWAEQWIGFSTDETYRLRDRLDVNYTRPRHPLIELNMSRGDCERWLRARGWSTTKSACIGCPFHGNAQWRNLRDNHPEEWAEAVAFDEAIRKGGARAVPLNGEAFLHSSRVPLSLAPIDRVSRKEWGDRQVDLLDVLAEEGDPDGCSPYGCRSGGAA